MASSAINDLTKAAAQFMAIRAATGIAGGGMTGFLLSSVATKGIDKLFSGSRESKPVDPKSPSSPDTGPEDVGRRIGEAAAAAIERILKERLNPGTNASRPTQAGPLLPKPGEKQTADEYIGSLNHEQLQILRNGGKPVANAANAVANQAVQQSFARVTGATPGNVARPVANPAPAAGAAAPAAGGAGSAGAGAAGVMGPVAAVAAFYVAIYEAIKAVKEMAYAQEQYARKLGEVNPTIAAQNLELDVNRMLRDMQSGDRLAASNQELISSINRFENATRTFEDLGNRLKNAIAADVMNGIAQTLESIEKLIEVAYNTWKNDKNAWEKFKNSEFDNSAGTFGDFLDSVKRESSAERAQLQARHANNRQSLDGGRNW